MCQDEPEAAVEWTLFGLVCASLAALQHEIAKLFFSGPHAWRQHAADTSKTNSRLLRLFVTRFLFDWQLVFLHLQIALLGDEGCSFDYVIVRHMWDETNQLILQHFAGDVQQPGAESLYESVSSPVLLQIGGFFSSISRRPVNVVYPVVRLKGLRAQHILGGILMSSYLFRMLFDPTVLSDVWKVIILCADDASSNRRLTAHWENLTSDQRVLIFLVVCMVHRIHTANKPLLKTIDTDSLYRWAGVFRITSYRVNHWSVISSCQSRHVHFVQHSTPDPVHATMFRKLLELTILTARPDSKYCQSLVDAAVSLFQHDTRSPEIIISTPSMDPLVLAKLRKEVSTLSYKLIFRRKMATPKLSDWTAVWECVAKIVLGYNFHRQFDLLHLMHDKKLSTSTIKEKSHRSVQPADLEDKDWAGNFGVRVAKTMVASHDASNHIAYLIFLIVSNHQCQLKGFLFKTTSGLNSTKYKRSPKDHTRVPCWELLDSKVSPAWACLKGTCASLKAGRFREHFDLLQYYFPDLEDAKYSRDILQAVLPLATRQWRLVFLPCVQFNLTIYNTVNPRLPADERGWWLHKLMNPTCSRCYPLATRRFKSSVRGCRLTASQKRMLLDSGEATEFSIVVLEHGHGRLRCMAHHSGSSTGGAFISTMSGHQQFFMQTRWHTEAVTKHCAAKVAASSAEASHLLDLLQEAEAQQKTPAFAVFCKQNGLSFAESHNIWNNNMTDDQQSVWRDIASAQRAHARNECNRLRQEISALPDAPDIPLVLNMQLGDSETPLIGNDFVEDPSFDPAKLTYRFGEAESLDSAKIRREVYEWAATVDAQAPVDEGLGENQVAYDQSCQSMGICKAMAFGTWGAWMRNMECILHIFRAMPRASLQDATRIFCFTGWVSPGFRNHTWFHLIVTDADDDPKFTCWGVRCNLRSSSMDRLPRDGSAPEPPYELSVGFKNHLHGPPRDYNHIEYFDFMSVQDIVQHFASDPSRNQRCVYQVNWTSYFDAPSDSVVISVHSREASTFWWRNGPVKDKIVKLPAAKRDHSAADDLSAIGPKSKPAKTPAQPRAPRKPRAKPKAARKLTEEEQLELGMFGILPGDVKPSDIPPDVLPGAGPGGGDGHDLPPLPPPDADPPSDPDLPPDGSDSEGGGIDIPVPLDFTPGEDGFISVAAARALIGPMSPSCEAPVTAPHDPSFVIGVLKWPRGDTRVWAVECRLPGHGKCSRMRTAALGERMDRPSEILTRWLVAGLDITATPGKSLAEQHMEVRRERVGPAGPAPHVRAAPLVLQL